MLNNLDNLKIYMLYHPENQLFVGSRQLTKDVKQATLYQNKPKEFHGFIALEFIVKIENMTGKHD
ncbi:hypothetical protein NIES2100_05030 [Calothrix sp. NIES-2100]|uniref:hypothetical protein n=1 Tax=Calothrix sp. NIES-2100 TaxID=1954172 RepID=UPI000B603C9D|nr:hypothetical protein NIES2100_05030 [Calothrix sp. NIES-2100]